MDKVKQIEEMAKVMHDRVHEIAEDPYGLAKILAQGKNMPDDFAETLYNAGYRKAIDVARETVEAIKAEARKKEQYVNDLFGYGGFVIATTDLEDIIRKYIFDTYEEDELRKKYTEEGK